MFEEKEPVKVNETVELEPTKEETLETLVKEYTTQTTKLLTLSADQLEDKSAAEIKRAVLEVDPAYEYTNKLEAIKHLITLK
jgi:23S rRNA A2030 N6-methylase RlmJ